MKIFNSGQAPADMNNKSNCKFVIVCVVRGKFFKACEYK